MTESSSVILWPPQIHQRYILNHGLEKVVDLWSPWPPPRSLSLQVVFQSFGVQLRPIPWPFFYSYIALVSQDWDTRGIEQIHYSWSLFVVHLEWCLVLHTKFFQAASNWCTCRCLAMNLELPWPSFRYSHVVLKNCGKSNWRGDLLGSAMHH